MKQYKRYTRKKNSNKKIKTRKYRTGGDVFPDIVNATNQITNNHQRAVSAANESQNALNDFVNANIKENHQRAELAAKESQTLVDNYNTTNPDPALPISSSKSPSPEPEKPENRNQDQNNVSSSNSNSNPPPSTLTPTPTPTSPSDSTPLNEDATKVGEKTTIKLMVFPKLNHQEKDKTKKPGDFVIIKKDEDVYNQPTSGLYNTEKQQKTIVVPQDVFTKIRKNVDSTDDMLKVLKDGIPKRNPAFIQEITITDDTSMKELNNELDKERDTIHKNKKVSANVNRPPAPILISEINRK